MVNKKLEERIVLPLGIFCTKTISFKGTEDLLRRRSIRKEDIMELSYRGKGYPGGMLIRLKDDRNIFLSLSDYYDIRFGSFALPRCMLCCDHSCELADVSFGDAWLPNVKRADNVGTSIVISRTKEADDILQQMLRKGKIELDPISDDKVYQSQGGLSAKKKRLKARLTISRFFGRKVPVYDYDRLLQPSLRDYLVSGLLYVGSLFATKRRLWWLLDVYCPLLSFASHLKSKLRL